MSIIKKIAQLGIRGLKSFLLSKGKIIIPVGTDSAFVEFYNDFRNNLKADNEGIVSIVFSKDRAMQLHAFLSSYFENVENPSPMIVLYKSSNENYSKAYEELENLFTEKPVIFVKETQFREQLINLIEQSSSGRVIFYVDDMIFTQKFNYLSLLSINPYKKILVLSRGRDMTYSMVLNRKLALPKFTKNAESLLEFEWDDVQEYSDWTYPLGVSGYMYDSKEILSIIKSIPFKAPNSLEIAMQRFLPLFKNRTGVCTEKTVSVCVHANLTQTEVENPVLGYFTLEELNDKWNENYQIDYQEFYGKSMVIAQKQNYMFLLRNINKP